MGLFGKNEYVTKDEMQMQVYNQAEQAKAFIQQIAEMQEMYTNMNTELRTTISRINQLEKDQKAILLKEKELKSDKLTADKVVKKIKGVKGLSSTAFKFFLSEKGYLNKYVGNQKCIYEINDKSKELKIIRGKNGITIFDPCIYDYIKDNKEELQISVRRYHKIMKEFKQAKKNLQEKQFVNYRAEIGRICGIKDNYDKNKWKLLYKEYEKTNPFLYRDADKYRNENIDNNGKKPSILQYIVVELKNGDALLRIACDLFVEN